MEMKQCALGGHYYDAAIHSECPYCHQSNIGVTVPLDGGRTPPCSQSDDGRTVVIIQKDLGIDPVVGWLVCTEGEEKGKDYRLHSDNNFIGRSEKMDVCLRGDDTVSRENHAILSYDSREKIYYFSPGEGRSIIRLNDKAVFATIELHPYDSIEIGKTRLLFLPLCGDRFTWA